MATPIRQPTYLAFLLRLWKRTDAIGESQWCATLERPGSSRVGFPSLETLYAYLSAQCDDSLTGDTSTATTNALEPTKESQ